MKINKGSPERFGYEWEKYSDIKPEYREQFARWLPFFNPSDWKDKSFLDVGCGMGRNSYWPLTYGAKSCTAIDVDDRSLDAARKNLECFSHATVEKISAYDIPYENKFDIVFSIGVIHHLEDPPKALRKMLHALKPGGKLAVWVYGYENVEWVVKYLNPVRKLLFSKLPIQMTHFLSLFPTIVLWIFLRFGLGKIAYFKLLRTFSFSHLRSIIFDQMLPQIAHYWKKEDVLKLAQDVGLQDIHIQHVNEMSWAVMGTKALKES